ncbi:hypothetical protein ACFL54_00785 [Planctomycetota bacterium]
MNITNIPTSTRWLSGFFLIAVAGVGFVLFNSEHEPLHKPNIHVLTITVGPLLLLLFVRILYNLFSGMHSSRDRAGFVSTLVGLGEIALTSLVYWQVGLGSSQSATYLFAYGVLFLLGFFLILLGDLLRNYDSQHNRPRMP